MSEASRQILEDKKFGLLFCEDHLTGFYSGCGWQEFRHPVYDATRGNNTLWAREPHCFLLGDSDLIVRAITAYGERV